jgi:hypothetical protein
MQHQKQLLLLSLPSGLLLKHCIPHMNFICICNLTSTCKEAHIQSPDWKQLYLAIQGINVSVGSAEIVWRNFYCVRIQRDPHDMAVSLMRNINTFVTNEIALFFNGHTPLDSVDHSTWVLERETFLHQALQECGYMSTREGRYRVERMLAYSGEHTAERINAETPNLPVDDEQIEQAAVEARIIASIPIMLHSAMVRMVPFVLERFVVDEVNGVVGV